MLALGRTAERESDGAFNLWLPDTDGKPVLDPSGVVKGWAVERAAAALRTLPDTDFCLSAGGDMTCHTIDTAGAPWRIGIEDPRDTSRIRAVIPVHNGAVATSGTAHRGQHLVDARTGRPPSGIASVTVVANSLTWADIDATAAMCRAATLRAGSARDQVGPDSSSGTTAPPRRCPHARTRRVT